MASPPSERDVTGGERTGRRLARWGLAALFAFSGTAHIVVADQFERLVPRWVPGDPALWNGLTTVAELGSAVLLANRHTARAGGWLALLTLLGVWPANIQAALDGGYRAFPGWFGTPGAAWIRVPLQLPLLWWAWVVARDRP